MTGKQDDLEAVREISARLEAFSNDERERILRWVRERLSMPTPTTVAPAPAQPAQTPTPNQPPVTGPQDIRTFVQLKNPKTENQLAAVVAYFHRFLATGEERKETIGSEDLLEACRKADRERIKRPANVLVNAFHEGLLDRAERGTYKLSTVGENLVAMVLPASAADQLARRPIARTSNRGKPAKKRSSR
jgi:hypothetical protein